MSQLFDQDQHRHWLDDGYVIAREVVPPALVQAMFKQIEDLIERAVSGEFGEDFRWTDEEQRVPAFINDLLTPSKYAAPFGEFLAEVIIPCVEELLGTPVRSSWLLLLTSGAGQSYTLPLHRDNNAMGSPDEAALNERLHLKQCYFQAPLQPHDGILQLVPGSHRRLATEAEIKASTLEGNVADVPGIVTADLEPGDVIFRSTNTLHRGWNPEGTLRWTLVAGLWAEDLPLLDIERQDLAGVSDTAFVESLPSRLRTSVKRYHSAAAGVPQESRA